VDIGGGSPQGTLHKVRGTYGYQIAQGPNGDIYFTVQGSQAGGYEDGAVLSVHPDGTGVVVIASGPPVALRRDHRRQQRVLDPVRRQQRHRADGADRGRGGARESSPAGKRAPSHITVDATAVYWTVNGTDKLFTDGAVMKLPK